ncbi:hypothetical protein BH23GEM11_BH23GEM11_01290 [soil metagenome]
MTWRILLAVLARLPQGALSRATGWVADLRLPGFLRGPVNGAFARVAGIDRTEAESPPADYPSVGAYFTRRLGPGVRSWPADPSAMASPVDGVVGTFGRIEAGRALQAKGIDYSVAKLLGDASEAAEYADGSFLTIYLSPRHYHRIHTPGAGRVRRARSIPGGLMPVNVPSTTTVRDLFPTNERLVVHIEREGAAGEAAASAVALVAVGAFNVGRITAAFDPGWVTNRPRGERPEPEARRYDIELRAGAELATFHLGSTVVLLFAPAADGKGVPDFGPAVEAGSEIRVGTPLFGGGNERI